jgi:hypothetical protein
MTSVIVTRFEGVATTLLLSRRTPSLPRDIQEVLRSLVDFMHCNVDLGPKRDWANDRALFDRMPRNDR